MTLASDSQVNLNGSSDVVNGSVGSTIVVSAGSSGDTLTGTGNWVCVDSNASISEAGTSNTINTAAGDTVTTNNNTVDVGTYKTYAVRARRRQPSLQAATRSMAAPATPS